MFALNCYRGRFFIGRRRVWRRRRELLWARFVKKVRLKKAIGGVYVRSGLDGEKSGYVVECI